MENNKLKQLLKKYVEVSEGFRSRGHYLYRRICNSIKRFYGIDIIDDSEEGKYLLSLINSLKPAASTNVEVENLLKKYIPNEKRLDDFISEAIHLRFFLIEDDDPLWLDKNMLNGVHCSMCGKLLDEHDIEGNYWISKDIWMGYKYPGKKFEARLCIDCFESVVEKILPMFKSKNPLQ